MKAIPASLLTDTVTVYPEDEASEFRSRYGEAVTYEHVRMDFGTALGSGSGSGFYGFDQRWAEEEQINGLLFVDAIRSKPAAPPPLRARIEMVQDGNTYAGTVKAVRPFKGHGKKTHHWEVLLG